MSYHEWSLSIVNHIDSYVQDCSDSSATALLLHRTKNDTHGSNYVGFCCDVVSVNIVHILQVPPLPTWINFNPNMDK